MPSLCCVLIFSNVLVLGIGIAQQFLSSIVLGIVLVCRPWYSPSLVSVFCVLCSSKTDYICLCYSKFGCVYLCSPKVSCVSVFSKVCLCSPKNECVSAKAGWHASVSPLTGCVYMFPPKIGCVSVYPRHWLCMSMFP